MIIYTPYGKGENKRLDIFNNKKIILEIAKKVGDEFFIMKDLDIIYSWGIERMERYLKRNEIFGAVALWHHKGNIKEYDEHVSNSFMMIRTEAIPEMVYNGKCFCQNFCDSIKKKGWRVKYVNGGIIHPNQND